MSQNQPPRVRAVPPSRLPDQLEQMGRKLAVTSGTFEFPSRCEVRDLDWNHMDQQHRPHVHHTYQSALRLAMGADFALSLTTIPLWKLGVFVLVTDVRLEPGLFYQSYTLFNVFYVHTIIRSLADRSVVEWKVVSHRWLKFLHPLIIRRLRRLNDVQNNEDVAIRVRRTELRERGFRFRSDTPDFLSSNMLTSNTIFPAIERVHRIAADQFAGGGLKKVALEGIDLLVRRDDERSLTVWTSVCPHEGGPLESGKVCDSQIECPWHGLRFPGIQLGPGRPRGLLATMELRIDNGDLVVSPASESGQSVRPTEA